MKFYPDKYVVDIEVPLTDLSGTVIVPVSVGAKLYDGAETLVADLGDIAFDPDLGSHTISIAGESNELAEDEARAVRVLRVDLRTDKGIIKRKYSYVIEGETKLQLLKNTFVSLESAELLAYDTPNMSGWLVSLEQKKQAALIEAFGRLTRLSMKFKRYLGETSTFDRISQQSEEQVIPADSWSLVTAEDFKEFPLVFQSALRKAQFLEANEILQGDNLDRKHRSGISSETVGESSITLRDGRIDFGMSTDALRILAPFLYSNMRVLRS